jgi:PKD domain/Glycosyl hydrolases family 39
MSVSLTACRRALPSWLAGLAVIVALLGNVSSGQSQTVTANFGGRSVSTPAVPTGLFAVGGVGTTLTAQGPVGQLTAAGLNQTRFWIPLQQVYATSTANFGYLDSQLKQLSKAGLHPIAVIYDTPPSLGSNPCGAPSNIATWGQMAASIVAHADKIFPGLVQDYEIWNEPELASSLCISDATTRLNTYVSMFAAAASAMHAQAEADGQTIRTGGPVISQMSQAATWLPGLLNNTSTAPYVDFVSFHLYITGQTDINGGMTWPTLYSITQGTHGLAHYYQMVEPLVRAGKQPNAASTPIYLSEYNDNWAYAVDCCRNDRTYAPLWNSLAVTDFLDTVYSGSTAVPSRLAYFNSIGPYFCIVGAYDADMDCDTSQTYLYPQFYAFELFASPNYLNLQTGGHMAVSVSPGSTTSGLSATAFYTGAADDVVIVNPTSTPYNSVNVTLANPGITSPTGTMYLLNSSNSQISSQSVSLSAVTGEYSATVAVPAYSTVAVAVTGTIQPTPPTVSVPPASPPASALSAVLNVTPTTGTQPLVVSIDSSQSTGGASDITGRTISFGDGGWVNWTPTTTHTYTKAGKYTIVLTIKNQSGQTATASSVVTVN